jgi:glycosyltransferase involved in cell wall biosynthesis
VIAKLEPGGAQLGALRLTRELRRHGVRSCVLAGEATPEGVELCDQHEVEVEVWNGATGLQYECCRPFARWLRERLEDADIVHAHMFGAWWAATRAVPAGVPLVASEHNALTWPGKPRLRQLRDALKRVSLFYAHGPAARRTVLAYGLPAVRLRPGLSSVDGFDSQPRPGLPAERVVFVGRLHSEKGVDLLIEALALIDRAVPTVVVGAGPMEPELRRLVHARGLKRSVAFAGWRPQPADWIAGASVLAVPSRNEAWSQAAVMAMGLGVPVVAASVEGLPITLGAGRGVLVPPEDPAALAAALEDVLAGRRTTNLEDARAYALRFSSTRVAAVYASAYRTLLAQEHVATAPAA